jgi:hypothetical protein
VWGGGERGRLTENRRREQVSARQAYSAHGHAEPEFLVVNLENLINIYICIKDLNGENYYQLFLLLKMIMIVLPMRNFKF